MAIDKPSLAAMLASKARKEAEGHKDQESTRPFILKDPKAIVKDIIGKAPQDKDEHPEFEDETYIQSLMKAEEPQPEEEFTFELPPEEEDEDAILKRIMGGK